MSEQNRWPKYVVVYYESKDVFDEMIDFYNTLEEAKTAIEGMEENLKPEILELTGRRWKLEKRWSETYV